MGNLPQTLPKVDGYIAALDCNQIGNIWEVQHQDKHGLFLVADCAGDWHTRWWMQYNQILAEVDYETAAKWQSVGKASNIKVCRHVHHHDAHVYAE